MHLSEVLFCMRGVTKRDQAVLRNSILRGPFVLTKELDKWVEPYLVADASIAVKGLGAFAIRGGTDDLGHIRPSNLAQLLSCVSRLVKEGDTVVDAGANIGAVTVHLSKCVGASGRVLAVEMLPETANRLRQTIALSNLGNVEVVEKALSSDVGQTITAHIPLGNFGQASIVDLANSNTRQVDVLSTTLDQVTSGLERIALIKMDLEGAEPIALAGALETLKRTQAIIFESWAGNDCETSSVLRTAGFQFEAIDGRNFLATRAATRSPNA